MKKVCLPIVLLLSSLSLVTLGACSPQENFSYDETNFLPNGTEENPYQIVKEPVTIKIFAPHSAGNPEYEDLKMFKKLSELTNLKFDFVTPDTAADRNFICKKSAFRTIRNAEILVYGQNGICF